MTLGVFALTILAVIIHAYRRSRRSTRRISHECCSGFVHFGCRYFSYLIRLNANLNNNLPPPFFEGMRKFRGW